MFYNQELVDRVHGRRPVDDLSDLSDSLDSDEDSSSASDVNFAARKGLAATPPSLPASWVRKSRLLDGLNEPTPRKPAERMIMSVSISKDEDIPTQPINTRGDEARKQKKDDAPRIYRQGYLLKQSSGVSKEWQRRFFRLLPTTLEYWPSEAAALRPDAEPSKRFHLISSAVRQSTGHDGVGTGMGIRYRPDRFLLRTPHRALQCEAEGVGEALDWCAQIEARIQACLQAAAGEEEMDGLVEGVAALQVNVRRAVLGERLGRLQSVPGNGACADCGRRGPDWASVTFGVLLCIHCAGVHRGLGSHLSRIRSLVFDDWSSAHDQVLLHLLQQLGNHAVNALLLASDEPGIPEGAHVEERQSYIRAKYVTRAYTTHCQPEGDPVRLLHAAVRSDDLLLHTASLLLRHRLDPNAVHPLNGMNAVHVAAAAGQLHQVALLVGHGGRAEAKDERGRTAGEVALRSGHPQIAAFLASSSS